MEMSSKRLKSRTREKSVGTVSLATPRRYIVFRTVGLVQSLTERVWMEIYAKEQTPYF